MAENPQNIIRSWNLQTNFATGPVVQDKLVPPKFGRIRTNFVTTWREENITNLDWDASNVSVYLPESLRVVSSIYLKVSLPALGGGAAYKPYPALYIIRTLRLLSAGQEVYSCDCGVMFADYLQSLTDEQVTVFGKTYLGHQDVMDGNAAGLDLDLDCVGVIEVLFGHRAYEMSVLVMVEDPTLVGSRHDHKAAVGLGHVVQGDPHGEQIVVGVGIK